MTASSASQYQHMQKLTNHGHFILPHASGTVHYSAKFQAYIWKPKVTLSKPIMENLKFLQNVQKLANHGHLIQESTS